jgi:hypothetical protein
VRVLSELRLEATVIAPVGHTGEVSLARRKWDERAESGCVVPVEGT